MPRHERHRAWTQWDCGDTGQEGIREDCWDFFFYPAPSVAATSSDLILLRVTIVHFATVFQYQSEQ